MPRITRRSRRPSTTTAALRQIRDQLGYSQGDLAAVLGTSQPAVLKTENAPDPRVSTLRRYVEGLAGLADQPWDLRLVAVIGDKETLIRLPVTETVQSLNHVGPPKEGRVMTTNVAMQTHESASAWRLRAWDDPKLEAKWFERGIVSISADEVGDLTTWPGDDSVSKRLSKALPDRGQQAIGMFVTYWRYFCREMTAGDIVVTPLTAKRAGIARIVGRYEYDNTEPEPRLRHRRQVEWLQTVSRSALDDDIRKVVNAPGTICRIGAPSAARRLQATT